MIPKAKTEAFEKDPPVNISRIEPIPFLVCPAKLASWVASIPGRVTCAPKRYTKRSNKVNVILFLNSSIFQTLANDSKNFFILIEKL